MNRMAIIAIRDMPILKHLFPKNKTTSQLELPGHPLIEWGGEAAYKNYAMNLCIGRLANALQLCDFQTFLKGEKTNGHYWYRFNFQPNINQNQAQFFHKIIYKMVFDANGALVIQTDEGDFIVVDSYDLKERAYHENIYQNIYVSGYDVKSIKKESEVFHFVLNNNQTKKIVDGIYDDYGKLLNGAIRNYNRNNATKYKLKIGAMFNAFKTNVVADSDGKPIEREDGSVVTEYDTILDDFMTQRYKGVLDESDSVTPLEDGLDLEDVSSKKGNTKSGTATTRDITDTFKDIIYMCADAFSIPRAYILGDVADGEVVKQNFIDDAVRPFADNMETEFNRKIYKFEGLAEGSKMKIQTNVITTKDPIKFANAAEAYLRIGIYTINQILEKLGEEMIDDEWANKRFVTKNYQTVDEYEREIANAVKAMMAFKNS